MTRQLVRRLRRVLPILLVGMGVGCASPTPPTCAPDLAIDAHAHVWNAQDLAVEGFVRQVVLDADEFDRWRYVKAPYMILVDFPYSHLLRVWELPGDAVQLVLRTGQWMMSFTPKPVTRYLTGTRWGYERESAQLEEVLYERRYCAEHPDDCPERQNDAWEQVVAGTSKYVVEPATTVLEPILFIPDQLIVRPSGIWTYYHAIKRNRSSRLENARQLLGLYPKVDAFVTALVDFEHWVGTAPATTPEEQVELLGQIAILSEGKMLPFVAYDPRRNIEEPGRALEIAQRAILEQGFVGIKLYPPMGFRPIGNAGIDVAQFVGDKAARDVPGVDRLRFGEALDRDLLALYSWAEQNGVPIMAHVNDSNGAGSGRGRRASPAHWAAVAKRFPRLRLNLGHFGGADDLVGQKRWLQRDVPPPAKSDAGNWTVQIIDLVDELGSEGRVYADTGMFSELLDEEDGREYFERLRDLNGKGTRMPQRLLYGSDWMMLALIPDHAEYYESACSAYQHVMPSSVDRYMGRNAASFLGLRRGEATRARLDAFYARHGMEGDWRVKVDAY